MCYLNKKPVLEIIRKKKELIHDAQVYIKSVPLVLYSAHQLK